MVTTPVRLLSYFHTKCKELS